MRRLAVFARAPEPGRVKSRLSPALPPALAARLYAGLLEDTFVAAAGCTVDERHVYWADEAGAAASGFHARLQRGTDLGDRLRAGFGELLLGAGDRALVIGSDTPALTAAHIDEAFAALDQHGVVLGPTVDGGYWCIGLKRAAPTLFEDIPWSTHEVLTRTLVRAHEAGLRASTVATLDDLDTPHDLALLIGALAGVALTGGAPACGSNARAALGAMGFLPAA